MVSKEIPNGGNVRVWLILRPVESHALSIGITLGVVGVDERLTPERLTETTSIAVYLTVREGGRERERKEKERERERGGGRDNREVLL